MAIRIPLITDFDGRGIRKAMAEFNQLKGSAAKTKFALEKAFLPATVALAGLAALGGKAAKSASDLAEAQSASNKVFGESSKEIDKFAKTAAKNLGQSQRQATQAATTFAAFGKSAGLSGQELVDFSTKFVTLASDMASFKNTSPEEAITAIGAAFRGETEPIRKYNVLLDDASLRQEALKMELIATTKQALTPQQKVLAASNLIMQQTTDLQGDFADTSDGLANSQRQLKASLEDTQAAIGNALLPIVEAILPLVEAFGNWAKNNSDVFLAIANSIGGIASAVFIANVAMKAWTVIGALATFANAKLGTSFTTLQASMGVIAGVIAIATTAYMLLKGRKNEAAEATRKYADALYGEGQAQRDAIRQLTLSNPNIQKNIDLMAALGFTHKDFTEYLNTGKGRLEEYFVILGAGAGLFDDATRRTDVLGETFINAANAMGLTKDALNDMYFALEGVTVEGFQFRKGLESLNNFGFKPASNGATGLTKELDKVKEATGKLQTAFREAKRGVSKEMKELRDNFANTIGSAITEFINFGSIQNDAQSAGQEMAAMIAAGVDQSTPEFQAVAARAGKTFIQGLTEQVTKARTFAERLRQLMAAGLSQSAITQVAQAGAEAGTQIADQLLAGGATTIGQANDLVAAAEQAAKETGTLAGATYYNEGVVLAQQLTKGITDVISKYKIKLSSPGLTEKQLNRLRNRFALDVDFVMSQVPALAQGGIVASPTLALIGEAGPEAVVPLDKMGQMGNVTINVNGGDPNAVVDALRTYMRQNGSVPIRVSNLY